MNSFCSVTGIAYKTITTRGCPHCLLDLHPEQGPLPKHTGQYIYICPGAKRMGLPYTFKARASHDYNRSDKAQFSSSFMSIPTIQKCASIVSNINGYLL